MNLKHLQLKNFRRFQDFEINFHEQLTVIVARNGHGKTSVLDAIAIALSSFTDSFGFKTPPSISRLKKDLPKFSQVFVDFENPSMSNNLKSQQHENCLTLYGKKLKQSDQLDVLPVIAYYGTGRELKVSKEIKNKAENRFSGYKDCLSKDSKFLRLQQWLAVAGDSKSNYVTSENMLIIQNAVDEILINFGWTDFSYYLLKDEFTMFHKDIGMLPVRLLGDSFKSILSIIVDLAFRCVTLNGFLGTEVLNKTKGIVLIDEIDLHLHPAWQQTVLPNLLKVFPSIQFIVTTNSQQVLSTIYSENIKIITKDLNAITPLQMTYGSPSDLILQDVMGVETRPPQLEIVQHLKKYLQLVHEDRWDSEEALALRKKLDTWSQGNESELIKADIDIRMRQFRRLFSKGK